MRHHISREKWRLSTRINVKVSFARASPAQGWPPAKSSSSSIRMSRRTSTGCHRCSVNQPCVADSISILNTRFQTIVSFDHQCVICQNWHQFLSSLIFLSNGGKSEGSWVINNFVGCRADRRGLPDGCLSVHRRHRFWELCLPCPGRGRTWGVRLGVLLQAATSPTRRSETPGGTVQVCS